MSAPTTETVAWPRVPMPGQVVAQTLRSKIDQFDREITSTERARDQAAAEAAAHASHIAELKAARAEVAAFLVRDEKESR